jgi:hypothetical protein
MTSKRWLIFRTYHNDETTVGRFEYLAKRLFPYAKLVWLHDGDSDKSSHYPSLMPDGCSSFANTDLSIRKMWPKIFESYDFCPPSTPRVFDRKGNKYSPKWVMGHLCLLQWWISEGRPDGRFITFEDDIWWDRDFNALRAFGPAFRHRKFLASMVKKYSKSVDSPQPPTINAPRWFEEKMICHDCIAARSENLLHALEDFSDNGAWGQVEVVVPSVAETHPTGGGCARWINAAPDVGLSALIHRVEGQKEGKKPLRLFKF